MALANHIEMASVLFPSELFRSMDYYCGEEEHFRKRCDQSTEEIKITGESCLLSEREAKSKRQHGREMDTQA